MKYPYSTISKPVIGKPAKAILRAVKKGSHVANKRAIEFMDRLFEQDQKQSNQDNAEYTRNRQVRQS